MLFERKIRFIRDDGTFDHTKYMELLNKARGELNKKRSAKSKRFTAASQPIII